MTSKFTRNDEDRVTTIVFPEQANLHGRFTLLISVDPRRVHGVPNGRSRRAERRRRKNRLRWLTQGVCYPPHEEVPFLRRRDSGRGHQVSALRQHGRPTRHARRATRQRLSCSNNKCCTTHLA